VGQPEEGLAVLAEALAVVQDTGEPNYEAGLYRLTGELLLQSKSDHRTFVHFTRSPSRAVILSRAKNLTVRPFASLRVTDKCANLVWFDLESRV
jgi:hypothetical protein